MLIAIEKAKQTKDWQKDGGQYIPYPATWLNARGWEDEIEIDPLEGKLSEAGLETARNLRRWLDEKQD